MTALAHPSRQPCGNTMWLSRTFGEKEGLTTTTGRRSSGCLPVLVASRPKSSTLRETPCHVSRSTETQSCGRGDHREVRYRATSVWTGSGGALPFPRRWWTPQSLRVHQHAKLVLLPVRYRWRRHQFRGAHRTTGFPRCSGTTHRGAIGIKEGTTAHAEGETVCKSPSNHRTRRAILPHRRSRAVPQPLAHRLFSAGIRSQSRSWR